MIDSVEKAKSEVDELQSKVNQCTILDKELIEQGLALKSKISKRYSLLRIVINLIIPIFILIYCVCIYYLSQKIESSTSDWTGFFQTNAVLRYSPILSLLLMAISVVYSLVTIRKGNWSKKRKPQIKFLVIIILLMSINIYFYIQVRDFAIAFGKDYFEEWRAQCTLTSVPSIVTLLNEITLIFVNSNQSPNSRLSEIKSQTLKNRKNLRDTLGKLAIAENTYQVLQTQQKEREEKEARKQKVLQAQQKEREDKEARKQRAFQQLDELIGLKKLKDKMHDLELVQEQRRRVGDDSPINLNFTFYGNAGTGKTTVARLMGEILFSIGLLNSPEVIEITKQSISSDHRGGTMANINKKLDAAKGKTLFIDEAYDLVPEDFKAEGGDALRAILSALENEQGKTAFIFAGYETEMARLFQFNQGFSSRIPEANRFVFADYTADEMLLIVERFLSEGTYSLELENGAKDLLLKHLSKVVSSANFGNARTARNIAQEIRTKQYTYTARSQNDNPNNIVSDEVIRELYFQDTGIKNSDDAQARARMLKEAEKDLDSLIALVPVKEQIKKWKNAILFDSALANLDFNMPQEAKPLNFIFVGSAGTGKTEVASVMGKLFYGLGLTESPSLDKVDTSDLIGRFVGETAEKARERLSKGKHCTMFIDEAYGLASNSYSHQQDFEQEAIRQLIMAMESKETRGKRAFILAGYKKEMEDFINSNSGIRSRVTTIEFPDYSAAEMCEIFKFMIKKKGFIYDDAVIARLKPYFEYMRTTKDFGNARGVRNTVASLLEIHKNNCAIIKDLKSYPDDKLQELIRITEDDCDIFLKEQRKELGIS